MKNMSIVYPLGSIVFTSFCFLCEMMDREKVGFFDFQSEDSQGMLIHTSGMYP